MSEKNNIENGKAQNGGRMARIGHKFHDDINEIQKERIKRGIDKEKTGTQKITNLITRHNLWKDIKKDLILANENEINKYG